MTNVFCLSSLFAAAATPPQDPVHSVTLSDQPFVYGERSGSGGYNGDYDSGGGGSGSSALESAIEDAGGGGGCGGSALRSPGDE